MILRSLPALHEDAGHAGEAVEPRLDLVGGQLPQILRGHRLRRQAVADDRETGEVLYRVPALYERNAIDLKTGRDTPTFLHVYISYRQIASLSPVQAEAYLKAELAKRNKAKDFDTSENIRMWNKIFERYSKPLIPIDGVVTKENNSSPGSDSAGLVYD